MRSPKVPGTSAAVGRAPASDPTKNSPAFGRIFPIQPARARVGAPEGGLAPRDRRCRAPSLLEMLFAAQALPNIFSLSPVSF